MRSFKICTIFFILLVPSLLYAGTWSHRVVKTKTNGNVIVEFTRSPTGDIRCVTFSHIIGDGSAQLNLKKWNLEANWSALNNFDMGNDGGQAREILWKLVTAIRNNPSLSITQATRAASNTQCRSISFIRKKISCLPSASSTAPGGAACGGMRRLRCALAAKTYRQ